MPRSASKVILRFNKHKDEMQVTWPAVEDSRSLGKLLLHVACFHTLWDGRSLVDELKERGYDISTFRMEIDATKIKNKQLTTETKREQGNRTKSIFNNRTGHVGD